MKKGGVLVTTYMSGIVNQSDNVYPGGYPGPLRDLAGVWVEEIDAIFPGQSNEVVFTDGTKSKCGLVCDLIHLEGAECLGKYGSDFYAGSPAVAKHEFGNGTVFYIGTDMAETGLAKVLNMAVNDAGVKSVIPEKTELEIVCRRGDNCSLYFVINFKDKPLMLPSCLNGYKDLLTDDMGKEGEMLSRFDVKILCVEK